MRRGGVGGGVCMCVCNDEDSVTPYHVSPVLRVFGCILRATSAHNHTLD